MITILAIALIILSAILYKMSTRNFDYWKKRKVSHPSLTPFLGNFADFMLFRSNAGHVSHKIYNAYPEDKYVGALMGTTPVLVIRDPELIKLIMSKDFYYFNSRGFGATDLNKEPLSANLFFTDGDRWRVLRQNLTPLFSSAKMKNMLPLMAHCGKEFERYLQSRYAKSEQHDMRDLMSRFSMDVIGSCAFGLQMNSLSGEDTEFRAVGYEVFKTSTFKSLKRFAKLLAPRLFEIFGLKIGDPKLDQFFIELSRKVIEMREGRPVERHDFVDLLVELKRKGHIDGDGIESMKPGSVRKTVSLELTQQLLAAQSFIFFAAGFETSSTTMSYTLYELSLNQDMQKRVQDEIDSLLKKYEGDITKELLQEATYLEKVICETMRMYPVLMVITRQCTSKYTTPDGLIVDEGVRIHVPVYSLHHDPLYYPKPHVFDPERFSPETVRERPNYTYLPFGEGQRLCIGMRFGKMQVAVGLISLLRGFNVEVCSRTEQPITFEPKSMITFPKNGIWLKLTPRDKHY